MADTASGPARAEIVVDLAAIRHNVRTLRELVGPGVAMMTVVKADGYGHGLAESARAARDGGAEWLGVATIDEALALRAAGDTGRVLCWLTVPGDDFAGAVAADVDVTAYSTSELAAVGSGAGERTARVQLKVDTGLSRGGAPREAWPELFEAAAGLERDGRIRVTGVWSHFSCSDEPDDPSNDAQEAAFAQALVAAERAGLRARGAAPRQLRRSDPAPQLTASTWCASGSRRTASTRLRVTPRTWGWCRR